MWKKETLLEHQFFKKLQGLSVFTCGAVELTSVVEIVAFYFQNWNLISFFFVVQQKGVFLEFTRPENFD